jgi:hypothetical protein
MADIRKKVFLSFFERPNLRNPWDYSVIRSHYVTMVDNNRGRFFLAVEPAYADVEYVFFISSRWCYMLLLSCRLHNCRPHRLDCGGCVRACATYSSCGHAPYYNRNGIGAKRCVLSLSFVWKCKNIDYIIF